MTESEAFAAASGILYYRFLKNLHRTYLFDWYMEIGCREGRSFAPVRSRTIAVDPVFSINEDVIGLKPELHIIQRSSDDFFASGFLQRHNVHLSLSFLDGMHLFEYLLRDFIGTERASARDGVIMLHDCCPWTHEMTTRDLDNLPPVPAAWTGDVWKLIPILQKYRPDLDLTVYDCRPTGVVALSNLDPDSRVLSDNYDEIIKEFSVDLETYGVKRFFDSFDYVDAGAEMEAGFPMFSKIGRKEEVADKVRVTP